MRDASHRSAVALALVVCMLGWLAGCGGGSDSRTNPPAVPDTPAPDTSPPSTPGGLTATVVSATRIDLSWNASTDAVGVAGYRIYRDGAPDELATVSTTSYSDTSVAPGTTYSYAVRAFDAAGNVSELSATVSATTPTSVPGLDARPTNATCLAWPREAGGTDISLARFTSLEFTTPIAMLQAPHDDDWWYVVQQDGRILRFAAADPTRVDTFIDLRGRIRSGGEMGLLGMAFHPRFPEDRRVFLSYTAGNPLVSRIAAFTSNDDGATLDPASEQILLTQNQPEQNHNGGRIAFGPDGYLYIGLGDGGGGGDMHGTTGNGQRLTTLLGKMLRIDVDASDGYAIPPSNPFAQNAKCPANGRESDACPEIFAWGFRNPWRWSFDRLTGELWVADVGQSSYEEVDLVTRGGNYGWRCREGAHDYATGRTPGCSSATMIDPVIEYGRDLGGSITGGYVYRGRQATSLRGRYVFGDFVSGRIFTWLPEEANGRRPTVLLESGMPISSFAEGNDGELYVLSYSGAIFRIVFGASGGTTSVPTRLSETGCVDPANPQVPASGLVPYRVNAPFWSDGAEKERWIALPDQRTVSAASDGDWQLPIGSVLMKHFRIGTRLIETRLLMRHPDGEWGGYSYEWNDAQTDALLVSGGAERDIGGPAPWIFPSETQCLECHTTAAGRTLGLETAQLNGAHFYPASGRTANQLATLSHVGMLSPPLPDPEAQPELPDPFDTNAPLAARARAYLHTNCSFCHRPGGPTPSTLDLRYSTPMAQTNACNAAPQSGDIGLGANARLITPADAASSVLLARINRRDQYQMPPLGSHRIDVAGVALIAEWIDSMGPSCEL
jgi:uncharacterized repeat protein (TIGR03806 family)